MAEYARQGDSIEWTATAKLNAGAPVLMGRILGVALENIANGSVGTVAIEGVFTVAKATGSAMTVGTPVHWDVSTKKLTGAATSTLSAGDGENVAVPVEPAASAANTCKVKLIPGVGTLKT